MLTKRQEYMKKYNKEYSRSKKGLIKYIYFHQIRNCKSRGHPMPDYSEEELFTWFFSDSKNVTLYEEWKDSGFNKELTPSIDRLDNSKSYSFDNIEAVTWQINKQRAYEAIRDKSLHNPSLLNGGHVAVVQFDLEGNVVGEFISLSEATRSTGIDHRGISEACKKYRNTFHGYIWRYLEDVPSKILELSEQDLKKIKTTYIQKLGSTVTIYYQNGDVLKKTLPEASKFLGISSHNLKNIVNKKVSKRTPKLPEDINQITIESNFNESNP